MKAGTDRLACELQHQLECLGVDTADGPPTEGVVGALRERAQTLHEMAQSSVFFYQDFDDYDEKAARKNLKASTREALTKVREALAALDDWRAEPIHQVVIATAEAMDLKLGKVAQPVRVAVCGGPVSPPIDITLELLGRDKTLARLDRALAYIDGLENTEKA